MRRSSLTPDSIKWRYLAERDESMDDPATISDGDRDDQTTIDDAASLFAAAPTVITGARPR